MDVITRYSVNAIVCVCHSSLVWHCVMQYSYKVTVFIEPNYSASNEQCTALAVIMVIWKVISVVVTEHCCNIYVYFRVFWKHCVVMLAWTVIFTDNVCALHVIYKL